MSQPPVDRERRVLYTRFGSPIPTATPTVGGELLGRIREGAHRRCRSSPGHRLRCPDPTAHYAGHHEPTARRRVELVERQAAPIVNPWLTSRSSTYG